MGRISVEEVQFADGLDAPDRLAFGLGAGQLMIVVGGALLAYALMRSSLPASVSAPAALALGAVAAALGWLRLAGRPALDWAIFVCRYATQPRSGFLHFHTATHPLPSASVVPTSTPAHTIIPLRPYVLRDTTTGAELYGAAHRHRPPPTR